jgi:hypothetical protein
VEAVGMTEVEGGFEVAGDVEDGLPMAFAGILGELSDGGEGIGDIGSSADDEVVKAVDDVTIRDWGHIGLVLVGR